MKHERGEREDAMHENADVNSALHSSVSAGRAETKRTCEGERQKMAVYKQQGE